VRTRASSWAWRSRIEERKGFVRDWELDHLDAVEGLGDEFDAVVGAGGGALSRHPDGVDEVHLKRNCDGDYCEGGQRRGRTEEVVAEAEREGDLGRRGPDIVGVDEKDAEDVCVDGHEVVDEAVGECGEAGDGEAGGFRVDSVGED